MCIDKVKKQKRPIITGKKDMFQLTYNLMKSIKIRNFLLSFFCLGCFFSAGFAQNTKWIYTARSSEGRYYIKKKIDQLKSGNQGMWMKIISDDGTEQISYTEWDCTNRKFRLKQTSTYSSDGTTLNQLKNLDWVLVSPESVSEDLIEEVCGNPREVKYAVIILKEVKLRDTPGLNGQVYRTAKLNEKFPLTPFNPVGAWYQIYDPETLVEYWVHENGIKVISGSIKNKEPEQSSGKSKKKN